MKLLPWIALVLPIALPVPQDPDAASPPVEPPLAPRPEDPTAPPLWVPSWDLYWGEAADVVPRIVLDGEPGEEPGGTLELVPGAGVGSNAVAARGLLEVEQDEVRFLKLQGARLALVNGTPVYGDPERRGWEGFPVALRAGVNELWVLEPDGGFWLELWKPSKPVVLGSWAPELVLDGEDFSDGWSTLWLPVYNASLEPVQHLHFHYDRAVPAEEVTGDAHVATSEWADGSYMGALGMCSNRAYIDEWEPEPCHGPSGRLLAPLTASASDDEQRDARWLPFLFDGPYPGLTHDRPDRPAAWSKHEVGRWLSWSHAVSGDAEADRAAFEVARFLQQEAWYRNGWAIQLVPDRSPFENARDRAKQAVVRIAIDADDEALPDDEFLVEVVPFDLGNDDRDMRTVRASSERGLRRAILRGIGLGAAVEAPER